MESVAVFLLGVAGILLVGTFGELLARRTGLPAPAWLIAAGVIIGPVLGLLDPRAVQPAAPFLAPLVLVAVIFESGTRLRLVGASRLALRTAGMGVAAFLASGVAVAVTSVLAASIGWLPAGWSWGHGWLLGAVLGSASSTIAIPALTVARAEPRTVAMAGQESSLTDALALLAALALLDALAARGVPVAGEAVAARYGLGAALGVAAGLIWLLFLKALKTSAYGYPVTLGVLLLLFVGVDHAGGDAPLALLLTAVVLGNAHGISRGLNLTDGLELGEDVRGFHSQLAFVMKAFFYTYMGLHLGGPWWLLALGGALGVVLLAARWTAVAATVRGPAVGERSRRLLASCMPRGLLAGVLAVIAASRGIPGTGVFPVLAFACVLSSIVVFVVAFTAARRQGGSAAGPSPAWRLTPPAASPAPPPAQLFPTEPSNAVSPTEPDITPGSGFRW